MLFTVLVALLAAAPEPTATLKPFIAVNSPITALTHVRVIDGTGAAPLVDQTILLSGTRIQALGPFGKVQIPKDAKVLDLAGATVLPGLVGMHDHLFMMGRHFKPLAILQPQPVQNARLYLASGVTTIRTTGSADPMADLNLKRLIDTGLEPGPKVFVTGPYLEGEGGPFLDMLALRGPEDATLSVNYWASQGATSFKAYTHITRAELVAAIRAAHAHGFKVTGHLCTIGFHDAIEAGIDNLEHGFFTNSDLVAGRKTDECPDQLELDRFFATLDVNSPTVKAMFRELIDHKVAITSTLAVFEGIGADDISPRVLALLSPEAREQALANKVATGGPRKVVRERVPPAVKKEMELERAFVAAGGTLLCGSDSTGAGDTLAGLADHRAIELLVDAGFTPLEAIRIATKNGAEFLGEAERIGTVTAGKQADLLVVRGDPSTKISELENVELVFKDGVGFDPKALLESVRGKVGR
ncbi:MAG: amidohydrolase family protein [Myxococcaceae bacterium]